MIAGAPIRAHLFSYTKNQRNIVQGFFLLWAKVLLACDLIAIICASTLFREAHQADNSNTMLMAIGTIIGHGLDFPYSPIRLIILTLPLDVSETILDAARLSAGVTFVI